MEQVREISSGPSAHITTDVWTLHDRLGNRDYAHAIAKFLTHFQTKPPISISIDSPWGVGKTSLMRMIQHELDADAAEVAAHPDKVPISPPQSKATVEGVQQVIKQLRKKDEPEKFSIQDIRCSQDMKPCLTIWFDAWKYDESAEQIWAGLADTITNQISEHLEPDNCERFWSQLYVLRLNADRIRRRIYDQILSGWWWSNVPRTWKSIIGRSLIGIAVSAIISVIGAMQSSQFLPQVGVIGVVLSIAVGMFEILRQYNKAKSDVEDKPGEVSLDGYADIPDYHNKLGFIHQVKKDLQRIFGTIKEGYPIIIFINDLHRCRLEKLVEVVQAVTHFMSEFPRFMFVIGMDSVMVEAAIEEAHNTVISKQIRYSESMSIGREFIHKLIMLPFVIPSPNADCYAKSLLFEGSKIEQTSNQIIDKSILTDDNIGEYSSDNSLFHNLICKTTDCFSNNPRDIKRFANVLRFQYFLWVERKRRMFCTPSLKQLTHWIILSMKWPEVVRWLQWNPGGEEEYKLQSGKNTTLTGFRLMKLENIAKRCKDLNEWQKEAKADLQLKSDIFPWITDDNLRKFFKHEASLGEEERLSNSAGKGFY